ncbi:MAG: hypothetical protein ACKO96_16020 [Flammeovirgaceae bacterium]
MKTYTIVLAGVAMSIYFLTGCSTQQIRPTQLLMNPNFEAATTVPVDWSYISDKDVYIGEWSAQEYVSPNRSLKTTEKLSLITGTSDWMDKTITLSNVKATNQKYHFF